MNVVVENQYRRIDHDHFTRGLAYAVALDCRALVVVAEEHSSEFVAIADYLNKAFESLGVDEGGVAVYLARLGVNKVGTACVPSFDVVSRPNAWLVEVQASQSPGGLPAGSKEAFVAQCAAGYQRSAAAILDGWERRDRGFLRFNPGSASVSLDYPYDPASPTKTSIFVLYKNGQMTVNRGYFLESVVLTSRPPRWTRILQTHSRVSSPCCSTPRPTAPSQRPSPPSRTGSSSKGRRAAW